MLRVGFVAAGLTAHNHMRLLRSISFVVFTGLVVACGSGSSTAGDVVRTDSAGVRIITSGARDTVLPWTFEELDVLRDSLGEPWLFTNVFANQVLADRAGRTYVLTGERTIVRFGRDGRYERTIGRRGGGPGEFQFPIAIGAKADTVFALDVAKRALVRFAPDLSPIGDQRLEGALASVDVLAFRTGGLWFRRSESRDSTISMAVFADTLGGEALRRVTAPLGAPVDLGCVQLSHGRPLFMPQVTMHANGPRLLVNAQPEYELWLYEGPRVIASIRRPLAPRAPTEADVRALYPKGMIIGFGGTSPNCVVPVEELVAKQGVAKALPFVNDVLLLSDGTMWALRTPHAVTPAIVDVFGSDGAYQGTIRGQRLPLALLPNGELLVPREDVESGGTVIARMKVIR
jgi:hypothetical protein